MRSALPEINNCGDFEIRASSYQTRSEARLKRALFVLRCLGDVHFHKAGREQNYTTEMKNIACDASISDTMRLISVKHTHDVRIKVR